MQHGYWPRRWPSARQAPRVAQDDASAAARRCSAIRRAPTRERVYLDFDVLDGYYLYRARFGFDSGTSGVAIGAAGFPRGETHTDEFFGEQEIYRGGFAGLDPVSTHAHRSRAST